MKINNQTTDAKHFAFDGCHKIYLIESQSDADEALESGYRIYPIANLEEAYEDSCALRFISNWQLNKQFVEQFTDDVEFNSETEGCPDPSSHVNHGVCASPRSVHEHDPRT